MCWTRDTQNYRKRDMPAVPKANRAFQLSLQLFKLPLAELPTLIRQMIRRASAMSGKLHPVSSERLTDPVMVCLPNITYPIQNRPPQMTVKPLRPARSVVNNTYATIRELFQCMPKHRLKSAASRHVNNRIINNVQFERCVISQGFPETTGVFPQGS